VGACGLRFDSRGLNNGGGARMSRQVSAPGARGLGAGALGLGRGWGWWGALGPVGRGARVGARVGARAGLWALASELGVLTRKIVSGCRERVRQVYYGAVVEIKKEIPA